MSSQPAPALVPQPEPPKEIPELTDAYRKAHKSYVLASGLLAAWELIGISLKTEDKWGIVVQSPKAVPLILFTLVIYSGYKTAIEWMQCNPERKKHPAAKWDYRIAHLIGFIAVGILAVQSLLRIQIVDVLGRHENLLGLTAGVVYLLLLIFSESRKAKTKNWAPALLVLTAILYGLYSLVTGMRWVFYGMLALAAFLIISLSYFWLRDRRNRHS